MWCGRWRQQLLARFATQFGPKDLRRLAKKVVEAIDPDGTLPDEDLQQDRRFLRLRPTKDGSYAGEFRLTADCGTKLLSLPAAVGEAADQHHHDRGREAGRRTRPQVLRAADARRPARRLRSDAPYR